MSSYRSNDLLRRAATVAEIPSTTDHAGRRVDVVALRYGIEHADLVTDGPNVPSPVTGVPGERYLEAFAPGAVRRSFNQRPGTRPARNAHGELIGGATFFDGSSSLDATITLNRDAAGDAALERVQTGAHDAASIGFRPVRHRIVRTARGSVVLRTEIDLREISLAPSDRALHSGARVLAVRSTSRTPRLEAHRTRMSEHDRRMATLFAHIDRNGL